MIFEKRDCLQWERILQYAKENEFAQSKKPRNPGANF
jgi:hypothetical protein